MDTDERYIKRLRKVMYDAIKLLNRVENRLARESTNAVKSKAEIDIANARMLLEGPL